ncbi:MAG: PPC domain-containing protein, partial [Planctomycetota bacterium]
MLRQFLRTLLPSNRATNGRRARKPAGCLHHRRPTFEPLEARLLLAADAFETNDTWQQATDLGTISVVREESVLSIDPTGDVDWFKFELAADGNANTKLEVLFTHANGDIDLELYRDPNDAAIDGSYSITDNEDLSLDGLSASQTYYVKVYGFAGATNTYDLRLVPEDRFESNDTSADATDFGTIVGVRKEFALSIHDDSDVDWFKFELATA